MQGKNEVNVKEALANLTAAEFKKNNGLVMRSVVVAAPMRWIGYEELKIVVGNRMGEQELKKALIYLVDEGYLKSRLEDTKEVMDIMDAELEWMEFRMSPKGTRLIECVERDELIDL